MTFFRHSISRGLNLADFADPMTFFFQATLRLTFGISSIISQQILDGLS